MDIVGEERGRVERAALWLQASRAELVGLAVLLAGAVAAAGALWWSATRPAAPSPAPSGIATSVAHDDPELHAGEPGEEAHHHDHHGHTAPAGAPAGGDGAGELTVHVTGAVDAPGLITVPSGARVAEAIAGAGDASADAELDRLNLARPLTDGEQVHVPRRGEEPSSAAAGTGGAKAGTDAEGRVDLNRADAATLETLPGIGPSRAAAIVEYREAHGPFAEPGDLRAVSGIGEATFQRLAEDVTVP